MKAARIHRFGGPDVIVIDDLPRPEPGANEILVRVKSAGVGPWDAFIREQQSVVHSPLPITLGSDLSGLVEAIGPGVTAFQSGDEVYGVTNPEFVGGYAEFAVAKAGMIAPKPLTLSFEEAAGAPVVAVTAWQMLFEYAEARQGQSVLIHGAGGSVGAFAVQLATHAGLQVFATASASDIPYVRNLGADTAIDYRTGRFEQAVPRVDIVLDTIGGETRQRSFAVVKAGGILVSIVPDPMPNAADLGDVRGIFFLVEVTTERLERISELFERGKLTQRIGTVLPLEQAQTAHRMLAGAPHDPGKIVLRLA